MPRRPAPPPAPVLPVSRVADAHPGDTLCGYRLVRKLGEGPRAEVFLGFGESTADSADPVTAAVKVLSSSATANAMVELEALARATHPHVVRLADAATTPTGAPCIVMERLSHGSLAHLLERRITLRPGEAVTILAPIALAVDALHAAGVAHGALGPRAILFRQSGAPVIARFGRASLFEQGRSDAMLAQIPEVVIDRGALAEVAATVLARVGGPAADELADWARASANADAYGQQLADRLFDLAAAEPVVFGEEPPPLGSAVPARVATAAAHASVRPPRGGIGARLRALIPFDASAVVRSLRQVRTPVWVAAASVLVAIIAAVVLVPGGQHDSPAPVPSRSVASRPETTRTASPPGRPAPVDPAVAGDDPVLAASALVGARNTCVDELSALCFEAVDQSGSAALDDDVKLVTAITAGGEERAGAKFDASGATLAERLGDSALVDLGTSDATAHGKPASVLMIRTKAGWRIRDYLGS